MPDPNLQPSLLLPQTQPPTANRQPANANHLTAQAWPPPTANHPITPPYKPQRWTESICLFHAHFGGAPRASEFRNTRKGAEAEMSDWVAQRLRENTVWPRRAGGARAGARGGGALGHGAPGVAPAGGPRAAKHNRRRQTPAVLGRQIV